jgi:hypothetical protein
MIRIGAAVRSNPFPHEMTDGRLRDGEGGSCSGEATENGMKDLRLGKSRELEMR